MDKERSAVVKHPYTTRKSLDQPTLQFREPLEEKLADFPARETVAATEMIEACSPVTDQFPYRTGNKLRPLADSETHPHTE